VNNNSSSQKASHYLAILLLLNIFNFAHRQIPAALGRQIEEGLGISHAALGFLIGYAFAVLYALSGMVFGPVADRWNRPRLIAIGLTIWTAATAVSGFADNFVQIAVARALVGVGAAVLSPTALAMLSNVFGPKRRALASGVYYAGIPLGAGLCLIVVGLVEPEVGWRNCFHILGVAGMAFVPLVLFMKDPPRGARSGQSETSGGSFAAHSSGGEVLRELFQTLSRSPALVAAIIGSVLSILPMAAGSMGITWLQVERGFSIKQAGLYAGIILAVAGLLGNVMGGWLSDVFHKRWSGGRMWFLVLRGVVLGPIALAWFFVPRDSVFFYVCWVVASWSGMSMFGPFYATVQDLAPARIRASAIAFVILAHNLIGAMGPWIAGMIGDAANLTWGLVSVGCMGFLGIPFYFFAARRYSADVERLRHSEIQSNL
jgi:predicted MFS family arabinose efflux permease